MPLIRYSPLYRSAARCIFAWLQKSRPNCHSHVWTEILSGMIFLRAQKLSGKVWTQHKFPIISCADVLLSHHAVLQGCVRVGRSSRNPPGSRHDSKPRLQTINYPSKENKITYLGSFTTRATFWANLHVKMVSRKFSSSRDKAAIMAALPFPPEIKNSRAWNVIRLFAPPTPCNLFGNVVSK